MKKYMKAAVLAEPGKMLVKEVPIPKTIPGWVRIQTKAVGICGSDMHRYKGNYIQLDKDKKDLEREFLGKIYGHEVSGIVEKIGEGVTKFNTGDRVVLMPPYPCMVCKYCKVGLYQVCDNLKIIGYDYQGGFAEYLIVPENNLFKIPKNISYEEAAFLDVVAVGIHAVNLANISIADRVLIVGAGAIGLTTAALVKKAGARKVFITAKHEIQKNIAKKLGVDIVLDSQNDDVLSKIYKKTGSMGVDCVLESIGVSQKVMQFALEAVRKRGRIVFIGLYEELVCLNFSKLLSKEASIIGSAAYGMWDLTSEFELAVEILSKEEIPVKDMITHKFSIDDINEAFQQKLAKDKRSRTIKVVIVF